MRPIYNLNFMTIKKLAFASLNPATTRVPKGRLEKFFI